MNEWMNEYSLFTWLSFRQLDTTMYNVHAWWPPLQIHVYHIIQLLIHDTFHTVLDLRLVHDLFGDQSRLSRDYQANIPA